MMLRGRAILLSLVAAAVATVAAFYAEVQALSLLWRFTPTPIALLYNLLPAFLSGVAVFGGAGLIAPTIVAELDQAPWWCRLAAPTVLAALCGEVIASSVSSPDFGLAGQLFEWPLAAMLGAITWDLLRHRWQQSGRHERVIGFRLGATLIVGLALLGGAQASRPAPAAIARRMCAEFAAEATTARESSWVTPIKLPETPNTTCGELLREQFPSGADSARP